MAHRGRECLCYEATPNEVWKPHNSIVDYSKPLTKVDVAFALSRDTLSTESSISSVSHSPTKQQTMENPRFVSPTKDQVVEKTRFVNQSPTKEKIVENSRFHYAFFHGDPSHTSKMYYINMASHVTPGACADDELSERSYNDNPSHYSPGVTPRTNILSHMAKNKTSWVENSMHNRMPTAQRKSPILVKGRNPASKFETPYEQNKRSKDSCTKGVRDGRRFDLLPISKYLSQAKHVGLASGQETRLPLVRISSVQKIPVFSSSRQCYPAKRHSQRLPKTFFAQRDIFKPREVRSQPTRGEAAFVDIREQLPRIYKKQYNAPVVKMGRDQKIFGMGETAPVSLPAVT